MAYAALQHPYSDWNSRGKNQVKDNINLIYPLDTQNMIKGTCNRMIGNGERTTVYLHSQDTGRPKVEAINKYKRRNYFVRYFDK